MLETFFGDGVRAFITACWHGDESKAKSLLERDPGLLNSQDSLGYTGLMRAMSSRKYFLCRFLLSLPGLDTNLHNDDIYSFTALHIACYQDAPLDIVATLASLSTLETLNMKTRHGWTALMLTLRFSHHSISRFLLSLPGLDVDTNLRAENNFTALHFAWHYFVPLDIVVTLAKLSSREILKMTSRHGWKALINALCLENYSTVRLLLSLPGLDTNLLTHDNCTALYIGCSHNAPLDIVATLAGLSTWETINMRNSRGVTALDLAVRRNNISAVLFLSWIGAECRDRTENSNCYYTGTGANRVKHTFTLPVSLETWLEAGRLQDAQFWAVAANDLEALKNLAAMKRDVKLDKPKLRKLAEVFDHRIVWAYLSDLQSLAWERLVETVPIPAINLPPEQLLEKTVDGKVVKVLLTYRDPIL